MSQCFPMPASEIPESIRKFAYEKVGRRIRKFRVLTRGYFTVDVPWHEADREYYQLFKLSAGRRGRILAEPVDFNFSRTGMDGAELGRKVPEGSAEVPAGFVMACAGIYPPRCEIFTAAGQAIFALLPPDDPAEGPGRHQAQAGTLAGPGGHQAAPEGPGRHQAQAGTLAGPGGHQAAPEGHGRHQAQAAPAGVDHAFCVKCGRLIALLSTGRLIPHGVGRKNNPFRPLALCRGSGQYPKT